MDKFYNSKLKIFMVVLNDKVIVLIFVKNVYYGVLN